MPKLRTYSAESNKPEFIKTFSEIPKLVREEKYHFGLPPQALWGFFVTSQYPKPKEFWIVEKEGKPIARAGVTLSITRPGVGYFGFVEVDVRNSHASDAIRLLDAEAMKWFKDHGAKLIYGPMNFSTWFQHRLRVNPESDSRVFKFEPYHPPQYVGYFEQLGYKSCGLWNTAGIKDPTEYLSHISKAKQKLVDGGWKFTPFSEIDFDKELVPKLFELSLKTFSTNFLYEPIDYASFSGLYGHMKSSPDMKHSIAAYSPEGKFAAFCLGLLEQDHLFIKSAAVSPDFQSLGLLNAVISSSATLCQGQFKHFSGAMVKIGNRSGSFTRHGEQLWEHLYELYSKEI